MLPCSTAYSSVMKVSRISSTTAGVKLMNGSYHLLYLAVVYLFYCQTISSGTITILNLT